MAVILNGATGGIQLTSASGGTMSVNPPATATSYVSTLPAATGTLLNSASSLPAANLTGTVADARISALTASKLTGALPAISGASLTGIASGGLTQLADFATTSGTTITSPALDLSTYKFLIIVCNGVGCVADTGTDFQMTPNGGTVGKIAAGWSNSKVTYASFLVDLSNGIGLGIGNIASGTTAILGGAGGTALFRNSGLTTSTTSLAFKTSGSIAFNEGSIKLYGIK